MRRNPQHKPVSAKELAQALPESAWHSVTWREGTHAPLASRFAAVRVRPAHRDYYGALRERMIEDMTVRGFTVLGS